MKRAARVRVDTPHRPTPLAHAECDEGKPPIAADDAAEVLAI
jgi:hypothetical protein